MQFTVRFVGDPVSPETQDRVRAALGALGDGFDAGAFVQLRHRDGGSGILAWSGTRGNPVEDVLRGCGLKTS